MALDIRRPEPAAGPGDVESAAKERLRAYWNEHVTDWPIATAEPGSRAFFAETEAYRFEKLDYLERLIDYGGQAGRDVLDVGCGLGNDTARFAQGGARVTGIDIAPRAIELSERNFGQRGLAGRFLVMDGEAMTFPEASFDFVYCHTILHFTPDPAAMIREIHRVLRPGGTALLMSVNRYSWMRLMHRLARVEIDHLQAPVFHWFSPDELMAMAAPFAERRLVHERFPVATKVHKGLKSRLFNTCFVGLFDLLPRALVRGSAHHLLVFARKAEIAP
ncbi:MAG: class I SAM-dependent methyltransferase [Geminicoccaceae bacterium]|jgi:SAM-dependent methyltransferase|nr:class I SAM-dependent methyltransferase [Geminicoccaceae bacterium]MCB9967792.1 class I SAM-dependent methyltransferase [Geminicoccaceae bacterium]HRY24143.1 class I SAM-dependent methyltransferase [Geminicoccaceae bacterium]